MKRRGGAKIEKDKCENTKILKTKSRERARKRDKERGDKENKQKQKQVPSNNNARLQYTHQAAYNHTVPNNRVKC